MKNEDVFPHLANTIDLPESIWKRELPVKTLLEMKEKGWCMGYGLTLVAIHKDEGDIEASITLSSDGEITPYISELSNIENIEKHIMLLQDMKKWCFEFKAALQ